MVPPVGNDPTSSDFQSGANPSQLRWHLVGEVGIEPTQPKATDLQSGATLQLCRSPKFFIFYR